MITLAASSLSFCGTHTTSRDPDKDRAAAVNPPQRRPINHHVATISQCSTTQISPSAHGAKPPIHQPKNLTPTNHSDKQQRRAAGLGPRPALGFYGIARLRFVGSDYRQRVRAYPHHSPREPRGGAGRPSRPPGGGRATPSHHANSAARRRVRELGAGGRRAGRARGFAANLATARLWGGSRWSYGLTRPVGHSPMAAVDDLAFRLPVRPSDRP